MAKKITASDKAEILKRYSEFSTVASIAYAFNVSQVTVYKIIKKHGVNRGKKLKEKCKNGHFLTPENTRPVSRACRICYRAWKREKALNARLASGREPIGMITKCKLGHSVSGDNRGIRKGRPYCKKCNREQALAINRANGVKPMRRRTPLERKKQRVASEQKRRALKKRSFVEYVDPMILFRRDNGICGICGHEVHANAFHIDHIIPLSKGGEHSYANTQIAHQTCNCKKHAKILPHLAVVAAAVVEP